MKRTFVQTSIFDKRLRERGGFRVLFLDLPRAARTYLLYFYGKDEAEDLSADEKKAMAALVKAIKENLGE